MEALTLATVPARRATLISLLLPFTARSRTNFAVWSYASKPASVRYQTG